MDGAVPSLDRQLMKQLYTRYALRTFMLDETEIDAETASSFVHHSRIDRVMQARPYQIGNGDLNIQAHNKKQQPNIPILPGKPGFCLGDLVLEGQSDAQVEGMRVGRMRVMVEVKGVGLLYIGTYKFGEVEGDHELGLNEWKRQSEKVGVRRRVCKR